jgi:hypothetical protein
MTGQSSPAFSSIGYAFVGNWSLDDDEGLDALELPGTFHRLESVAETDECISPSHRNSLSAACGLDDDDLLPDSPFVRLELVAESTLDEVTDSDDHELGTQEHDEEVRVNNNGTTMQALEKDGIEWVVYRGSQSIEQLEDSLYEVKGLYAQKFGQAEHDEDAHVFTAGTTMQALEKDGVEWVVYRGIQSIEQLEDSLYEVKGLYAQKFGQEEHVHRGTVPSVSELLDSLDEVKGLYEQTYGQEVHTEEVLECDGVDFVVHRGAAPSVSELLDSLDEVKGLYEQKYGQEVCAEEVVDKDGVNFVVHRGAAPSVSDLLDSLDEVKGLYEQKFEEVVEKEGVNFVVHRGAAPSVSDLLDSLDEVKVQGCVVVRQ